MKALVINELHFFKDANGLFWTQRLADYAYFKRYLNAFESISVCARVAHVDCPRKDFLRACGPNVDFVELPDSRGIVQTLKELWRMKSIIRKALREHDAVITRAPSMLVFFLYNEIKRSGLPFSIDVALSGKKMIPSDGLFSKIVNKLIDFRLKKMCQEANGVSYVTEHVLQRQYPCKAMRLNDERYFTSSFSTLELLEEHYYKQRWTVDAPPKEFVLVNCGFMDDDRKCQRYLLDAFSMVLQKGVNAKLWLVGDGALRHRYELYAKKLGIEEKCVFWGLVSDKRNLLNILRNAHIFVFPTKAEGLPRSILEAMAQGLPCVSSPVDGVPELIEDRFLVDWWDCASMADKIVELCNNWEKLICVGRGNYEIARRYHNDILREKRTKFYTKLRNLCGVK